MNLVHLYYFSNRKYEINTPKNPPISFLLAKEHSIAVQQTPTTIKHFHTQLKNQTQNKLNIKKIKTDRTLWTKRKLITKNTSSNFFFFRGESNLTKINWRNQQATRVELELEDYIPTWMLQKELVEQESDSRARYTLNIGCNLIARQRYRKSVELLKSGKYILIKEKEK